MVRRLRLGLVGTGMAARHLYRPAFEELRHRIELVACTNRTRAKAEEYAAALGIPRVYDTAAEVYADPDVDAVMLSLPIDVAPREVLAALRAGVPVLTEKPNAATVAAGRRLLTAAAAYDVPYLVGENYAFMSHAQQLARWVRQGRLGEVRLVEVRDLTVMDAAQPWFHTTWRQTPAHRGGYVTDAGVHLAHVLRTCVGDPVTIRSLTAQQSPDLPPLDTLTAAMSFESGALGTWTSCFAARPDGPRLRISGSTADATFHADHAELVTHRGRVTRAELRENSFTAQFRHFADVVLTGATPLVTPAETLADLELLERLLRGR